MLPLLNNNNNTNSTNNNINNKAQLYQNKPPRIPTISFYFSKPLAIILPIHCERER